MPHEERVATLIAAFEREYGRKPEGIAEAPGRVNLIGEHVDYNDGLVLPFAIDRSVLCAWARAEESRAYSLDYNERIVDDGSSPFLENVPRGHWPHYWSGIESMIRLVAQHRNPVRHMDMVRDESYLREPPTLHIAISGDVPQGAGLSSSAALEVAVAGSYRDALGLRLDDVVLATVCHQVENISIGVESGIMDQFASALSVANEALLLDCRSSDFKHVHLWTVQDEGCVFVVANSAVTRRLDQSEYNQRRAECAEAVGLLRSRLDKPALTSLRDVLVTELIDLEIDSVALRRARHVVGEIARVVLCADLLGGWERDALARFGEYMNMSHRSLRDDYDVSSPELDLLVELAAAQPYTLGARLTGAGFGGCTVNLIRADAAEAFARDVIAPYRERTGLPAEMYVTSPQDGLRTWRL